MMIPNKKHVEIIILFIFAIFENYKAVSFLTDIPCSFVHERKYKPCACRSSASASSRNSETTIISTGAPMLATPPPLDSFAGKVEQKLTDRFGANAASRVIQSWRLLDAGYEHRQRFSSDPNSHFVQHAHSYVPGLTVRQFWDCEDLEWCQKLSSRYEEIRDEFLRVTSDMEALRRQGSNIWAGALTQDALSYGEGWRTLGLYDKGVWDAQNVRMFPITATAIRDSEIPILEVFFASMEAQSSIKMHSDFTNFVLTSHLPLVIPQNGENKCRLTIGDETRQWLNGKIMMFDTSIMHDAVNETDETRYILMLRVWHPDLTPVERDALQFLFDCLRVPELVSSNPSELFYAEKQLQLLRSFPIISSNKATTLTTQSKQNSPESSTRNNLTRNKTKGRGANSGSKGFAKR